MRSGHTLAVPLCLFVSARAAGSAAQGGKLLTGRSALGGWQADAPGVRRHLEVADIPAPSTASQQGRP